MLLLYAFFETGWRRCKPELSLPGLETRFRKEVFKLEQSEIDLSVNKITAYTRDKTTDSPEELKNVHFFAG